MKPVLGSIILVAIASGCGRQQNPVKQYNDLPGVAQYEQQIREQKFAVCGVAIQTPSTLIVAEGESASQTVLIRGINSKAAVVLKDAPEGVSLKNTTPKGSANAEYTLTANGIESLIQPTADYASFEVEIVPPSDDPALDCSEKVGIVLTRSKAVPVISDITPIRTLDSAKTRDQKFSITIRAPGTQDPLNLKVNRQFDISASSKENFVLDLSQAVRQTSDPKLVARDTYKIDFALVPEFVEFLLKEGLPKDFKKNQVEALFTVNVFNKDTGKVSPDKNVAVIIKIENAAETAETKK